MRAVAGREVTTTVVELRLGAIQSQERRLELLFRREALQRAVNGGAALVVLRAKLTRSREVVEVFVCQTNHADERLGCARGRAWRQRGARQASAQPTAELGRRLTRNRCEQHGVPEPHHAERRDARKATRIRIALEEMKQIL